MRGTADEEARPKGIADAAVDLEGSEERLRKESGQRETVEDSEMSA